jgi:uncharacterized protein
LSNRSTDTLDAIQTFARECCAGHDPAHDALHVSRVVANAQAIAGQETANPFVVEAAAWLHDIVQLPKGSGPPGESARRSASGARAFLSELSIPDEDVAAICHAIEAHSFSGGLKPESIEAAILQDADRLDALGAIGLARLWVVARALGSELYNESDPSGTNRDLDDRAYGLDHIPAKLLKLPDLMNTATGREMALQRAAFVREFQEAFLREIGVDNP